MNEPVFKISVKDVTPDTLPAGDLAILVAAIEAAIRAIAEESDDDTGNIIVNLKRINKGSASIVFASNLPQRVLEYWTIFATALALGTIDDLPTEAQTSAQMIQRYAASKGRAIRLNKSVDSTAGLYDFLPEGPKKAAPFLLSTETTIYGELVRIGGSTEPKARLRIPGGATLSCSLDKELALVIAPRLYTVVGLKGIAKYDIESRAIRAFRAIEILPYEYAPIQDALRELNEASGNAWDNVEDVSEAIRSMRGGEL